ncbi:MAG: hypothetical protein HPY83_18720 [Anaerolineae bacterium]|nr:hypothetical protein [Anaerolineae bacterium]
MYVRTSDPPPLAVPDYRDPYAFDDFSDPGPKRYWRGMTYDVYTGRGWANSRTDVVAAPGGRPFEQPQGPREQVVQDFEILAPREELLYAVADPVALDSDLRLYWRGEDDLAFLKAPLGRYSVVSEVLQVTQAQLRSAGTNYPAWVRERYLTLPEVPQRVVDLAAEVAGGADNPYDRLVAIQSYLRLNYDYDLQVPQPAEGKDVVDYFLFESRRGFCDYYASAMVVMARLAGVPARLASGYATGRYDYASDRYVVTAGQAHSWPEAYFPGLGWVEFEPTVVQSPFYRPIGAGASESPQVPEGTRADTVGRRQWWPPALLLLLLGASGALALGLRHRRLETDPVLRAYWAMEAAGARLGLGLDESLTPREYALRLEHCMGAALEELGGMRGNGREAARAAAAMTSVAVAYEQRRYGPRHAWGPGDGIRAWPAADRFLRTLALRRLPTVWARRLARHLRRVGIPGTAPDGASGPAEFGSS